MLHKRWISLLVCLLFAALAFLPATTAKAADGMLTVNHSTAGQLSTEITDMAGADAPFYTKLIVNIGSVDLSGDFSSGDWKTLFDLTSILPGVSSLALVYTSGNHFIPTGAMYNAGSWLKSLVFTNADGQLTDIGASAFYGCTGLGGTLSIPSSVTNISNGAFKGCMRLGALSLPSSGSLSIGDSAFQNCTGLGGTLTIPSSVTTIGNGAFLGCTGITALSLPASGSLTIGDFAFQNCTRLGGTLAVPASVSAIGNSAFSGCTGITALSLPASGSLTISNFAFSGCTGLKGTLTIPSSVTNIGNSAFKDCAGLSGTLAVPSSVTAISDSAFSGCIGLTALSLPANCSLIGNFAFSGCTGLSGTTIPSSVTAICSSAFQGCEGLSGTLTIPSSVTSIGADAFDGCTGLTALVFKKSDSAPTMSDSITDQTQIHTYYPASAQSSYTAQSGFPTANLNPYSNGTAIITSLYISGVKGVIDDTAKTVIVDLPASTNLSVLKPDIGFVGKSADPVSGAALDFSSWQHTCTVTSASGNEATYSIYIMGYPAAAGSNALSGTVGNVGDQPVIAAVVTEGSREKMTLKASIAGNESTSSRIGNGRAMFYFSGSLFDGLAIGRYPITVSADAATYNHAIAPAQIGTLTVRPASPVIKTAAVNGTSVTLTWDEVSSADGYTVYRYDPDTKAYTKIASTTDSTYTQNGLTPGTTCYYAVCSFQMNGSPIYSNDSAVVSAVIAAAPPKAPGIPSSLKAASASYNSIALKWNAVSGASGYTVYRALSSGGPYSVIAANAASTGYTNTGLVAGKAYYYKIKAYTIANGAPLYGHETAVVSAKPVPSAPASVKAKRKGARAALSWRKVSGASRYEVYRATASNGKYSCITVVKGPSYVNTRLSAKKTYYYKIRAYNLTGKAKTNGAFSTVLKVKP